MKTSWVNSASVLALVLIPLVPRLASSQRPSAAALTCEDLLPMDVSAASASAASWTLCKLVETGRLDDLGWPNFEGNRKEVAEFYVLSNYALAWVSGQQPTSQARAMIRILEQAGFDGLDPIDYDAPRWQQRLSWLADAPATLSSEDLARFDLALTVATIRYITDLHTGRVSPALFHFGLGEKKFDAAEFLHSRVVAAADVESVVKELEPPFAGYRRTKETLKRYLALAHEGEGDPIPPAIFPLNAGATYSGVAPLAVRLQRLGDLLQDSTTPLPLNIYSRAVVAAVQHFQKRHGIKPDGRLTQETYDQLTTPFARRVVQLQLTLERWRWLPAKMESPLIVVNIPEFQLRAYEDHHLTLAMRAIVGESSDHQTPVFANRIQAVVFRPSWNVPENIQKTELISELERHPHYLLKHQMQVVNAQGRVITEDLVGPKTMQRLQAGVFMVRQQPGPANALGLVKFVFPNQYSICMHGTPEMELFARARRDLSHGCIRVENPAALAAWVLRDDPHWTAARIKATMEGKDSIEVKLPRSLPILILYSTALVEKNGEVHFFKDIYGFDASLQASLEQRRANSNR